MLKRVLYVLLLALVVFTACYFGYAYLNNADTLIFMESASHLEEIYSYLGKYISSTNNNSFDSMHLFMTQLVSIHWIPAVTTSLSLIWFLHGKRILDSKNSTLSHVTAS